MENSYLYLSAYDIDNGLNVVLLKPFKQLRVVVLLFNVLLLFLKLLFRNKATPFVDFRPFPISFVGGCYKADH